MAEHHHQGHWKLAIGFSLIIFSFIPFILVFIIPFLGFPIAKSTVIVGFLIIIAEISFYLGIAFVGKSLFHYSKAKIKDLFAIKYSKRKYLLSKTSYFFALITFYLSILLFLTAAMIPFIDMESEQAFFVFIAIVFAALVLLTSSLFFFKEKRRMILKKNKHK